MRVPASIAALATVALLTVWTMLAGGTHSAYTALSTTPSNSFAAAADWTSPTIGSSAIGRTTAYDTGVIKPSGSYYVYANVSDSGNPASGTTSVTANVSGVTSGQTALALAAGSYSAGGASFNYRSAAQTASSSLGAGSHSYTITATDAATNSGSQSFSVTGDSTTPGGSDVQSTNVSGGTVGRLEMGDTFTLTYSEVMDPYSVLSGWTGSATTGVQVKLVDGGGGTSDYLQIWTATGSAQLPLGTVYLNSTNYVKTGTGTSVVYGGTGASTQSTMTRNGASITLTLGSIASGTPFTSSTAAAMTWTPSATATDIAGNAARTTTATQSGTVHVNF
jgi:hypothetical protein